MGWRGRDVWGGEVGMYGVEREGCRGGEVVVYLVGRWVYGVGR